MKSYLSLAVAGVVALAGCSLAHGSFILTLQSGGDTVIVQDNQGGLGFANATSGIVVPTYAFNGFGSR